MQTSGPGATVSRTEPNRTEGKKRGTNRCEPTGRGAARKPAQVLEATVWPAQCAKTPLRRIEGGMPETRPLTILA